MERLACMVLVLAMGLRAGSADPGADRQQRLAAARMEAIRAAETQPTIKAKAFAKAWEREFAKLTTSICACSFGDIECGYAHHDAFDAKLAGLAWRIEGREALFDATMERAKQTGEDPYAAGARAGEQLVASALDRFVPAARMKKLTLRAERCALHASGEKAGS